MSHFSISVLLLRSDGRPSRCSSSWFAHRYRSTASSRQIRLVSPLLSSFRLHVVRLFFRWDKNRRVNKTREEQGVHRARTRADEPNAAMHRSAVLDACYPGVQSGNADGTGNHAHHHVRNDHPVAGRCWLHRGRSQSQGGSCPLRWSSEAYVPPVGVLLRSETEWRS